MDYRYDRASSGFRISDLTSGPYLPPHPSRGHLINKSLLGVEGGDPTGGPYVATAVLVFSNGGPKQRK